MTEHWRNMYIGTSAWASGTTCLSEEKLTCLSFHEGHRGLSTEDNSFSWRTTGQLPSYEDHRGVWCSAQQHGGEMGSHGTQWQRQGRNKAPLVSGDPLPHNFHLQEVLTAPPSAFLGDWLYVCLVTSYNGHPVSHHQTLIVWWTLASTSSGQLPES